MGQAMLILEVGKFLWGDGTRIHNGASLYGELKIGRHCSISKNFFASAGNHDMSKPSLIKYNDEHCAGSNKCIDIHDDVWVGYNVFVKQGLTIGRGAVIGACSAVTKDVFPYTVVGGVPARIIKKRFVYCPPERLDSVDPGHLPYFYSGFDQRSQSCCEEGYRVVDKSALMSLPDTFEMGSIELRANCMGEGSEFLYGDRKKARLTSKHSTVELSVNYEDVTVDCFGNKFIKLMFQNEDQIRIKGITIK